MTLWPLPELNPWHAPFWPNLWERQRMLLAFAGLMMACALLTLAVAVFDDRLIRGANVWLKPLKFMVSTAAFALTTCWLMGLLAPGQRESSLIKGLVWVLIATATFEVAYITAAAALGGESHHNTQTTFSAWMFTLMALAAVALTSTQAVLAWAIWRHTPIAPLPVAAQGVLLGLVLTWGLGTASGFLLGGRQPPAYDVSAVPVLGWQFSGGDGRPAHFLGLHAHQLIVLLGFLLQRHLPHAVGVIVLWIVAIGYTGAWWWLMRLALR